jgi:hypothetical protein
MPKKLLATTIIIATILVSIFSTLGVQVTDANPLPWFLNPQMTVSIQSPTNGTVSSVPVWVNFTSTADNQFSVSDNTSEEWVRSFFYVLDGQNMNTMGMRFEGTRTTKIYANGSQQGFHFEGQAYLANLADGPHTITVYYGAVNKISYVGTTQEQIIINPTWQATSQFYVDSKLASGVTVTPSPTPSQSIPTINTSSTLPVELNPAIPYIILAVVITIAAIASVLLVFFKRHKPKPA